MERKSNEGFGGQKAFGLEVRLGKLGGQVSGGESSVGVGPTTPKDPDAATSGEYGFSVCEGFLYFFGSGFGEG